MKKYLFLFLAAFMSLGFVACSGDDDDNNNTEQQQGQSIIGQWSGVTSLEEIGNGDVRMHYKFNQDGTFDMIMEAWAQHRTGTYAVKGNEITMDVRNIEWLWDRGNGYANALEESGYESFDAWKADRPEDWHMKATYEFGKDGYLHIFNTTFNGMDLLFFSDPNYVPKKHLW